MSAEPTAARVLLARRVRRTAMTLLLALIFWTIAATAVGVLGDLTSQQFPTATAAPGAEQAR